MTDAAEYTGTTVALESVQVRARVTGFLDQVHFEPRAKVHRVGQEHEQDAAPIEQQVNGRKNMLYLACTNAVLIVEFAKQKHEHGLPRFEAVVEAATLRLRPIIMTSLAFILGVVPLVLAKGAGAEMRHTLGVTVFAGMLGVTFFGIFLTPIFYNVLQWIAERRGKNHGPAEAGGTEK